MRIFALCASVVFHRFATAHDDDGIHLLQVQAVRGAKTSTKVGDPGEDAIKFCNTEELSIGEPSVNNLDGSGDGPKMILYPSIKSGVDLMVTATDEYRPYNADVNGFQGGFGNLNLKTGTGADFTFTFVQSGTTNPVVLPQFSISFFDLDEGKRGKGRGTLEVCGVAASFLPSSTELAQQFQGDCVKTTTCKHGTGTNHPPNPFALTDDHLNRATTLSFEQQSSATLRLSLGRGKRGRNFMFSLTSAAACAKTTTTTTSPIPTTQPPPHCPQPTGPFRFCNGHDDPMIDRTFLPGRGGSNAWKDSVGYHAHQGLGIFWAARTKNGDGVQLFQVPIQTWISGRGRQLSSIGGVAVKIGNDIITYTPTTFHNNSGTAKVKINGKEYTATDVNQKTSSGYVVSIPKNDPQHIIAYDSQDIDGLCVVDDSQSIQLKLAKRDKYIKGVEFQFALNMNEDIFDETNSGAFGPGGKNGGGYGQICMDGGSGSTTSNFNWDGNMAQNEVEAQVHDSQRVDYNESWFGAQELGEICDNLMKFNALDMREASRDKESRDLQHIAGCDRHANYLMEKNNPGAHTPEEICDSLGVSWEDAQSTCANVQKQSFKEACLVEYCNDFGDANAAEIAEGVEEDIEAAQASADESHHNELNFTPQECCSDDVNCDRTFTLA